LGRELLAPAKAQYGPNSSLYELLQQKDTAILTASDGGQKDDHGSFGWVIGTKDEVIWDCEGVARGYTMQSYRAEGYGRMSLLLFLAHYIKFYEIKLAAGLRLISYCDSFSLLKAEKAFREKDVDSSSSYLKPDHDVIMTLSEVRKGLPFELISQHVESHQDKERDYDDLTRPEQLNVLADRCATAALDQLCAGERPQRFTHFLRVGAIFVIATVGISPVVKYAHSETHSLSKSFETICNAATNGQTRPTTQSIGLPMVQPVQHSLTAPEHS
jgi:hypothetical protein